MGNVYVITLLIVPDRTVQYCTNKVATSSASVGCMKKKMKHVKKSSVVHYVKNVASLKMHQRAEAREPVKRWHGGKSFTVLQQIKQIGMVYKFKRRKINCFVSVKHRETTKNTSPTTTRSILLEIITFKLFKMKFFNKTPKFIWEFFHLAIDTGLCTVLSICRLR